MLDKERIGDFSFENHLKLLGINSSADTFPSHISWSVFSRGVMFSKKAETAVFEFSGCVAKVQRA